MGNKAEIGWIKTDEEGRKWDIFARQVGRNWAFYCREKRYDRWLTIKDPRLEDWIELLDGVRRRVTRRLYQPDDEARLVDMIRHRFPEWKDEKKE